MINSKTTKYFLYASCAAFVLAAISIYLFDHDLAVYFSNDPDSTVRIWAHRWTKLGKATGYVVVAVGVTVIGWGLTRFSKFSYAIKIRNYGVQFLSVLVFSGLTLQVLKHLVGRVRPYASEGFLATQFDPLTFDYRHHSMPSGHTQVVFAVATYMSIIWPKGKYIWFALAVLLAVSRVITLNHWLSDTIMGALVGVIGALIAQKYMETKTQFTINPTGEEKPVKE